MTPAALTADGRAASSPTAARSLCSAWASGSGGRAGDRERGSLGARARLPPHRHRTGLRQRGERRPRAARQRRAARGGLHHDQVLSGARRTPEAEAQRSLERLGVDQVDLYIIHWPQGGPTWAWPGMERARERGYARSIGVSNFSVAELDELLAVAESRPVVNQVQFSPFKYRRKLLDACEQRGVALEAYSPLGTGRHLADARVQQIAERVGTHAGAGAAALVRPARPRRDPEVDAPRADRGERPDLRLHPLRRGHGRARRARRNRRHDRALERAWW